MERLKFIGKIVLYCSAFIVANLIVFYLGPYGLIISSLLLIPFDFVMRCYFHEKWSGFELILNLGFMVLFSAGATYILNPAAENIAIGSVCGFIAAQIFAGLFYQKFKWETFFVKVNGSDLIAIISDSIIFQLVAFGLINWKVTAGQILMKAIGGLFWYWIIFVKLKLVTNGYVRK